MVSETGQWVGNKKSDHRPSVIRYYTVMYCNTVLQ